MCVYVCLCTHIVYPPTPHRPPTHKHSQTNRAHCTHVLSSPDALRARISPTHFNQPSATSTSSTTNALPPLPAAVFAVEALDRLLSWAAAMPLFASNLAGVVTNLLERVLEGFVGRGKELLGRSMAATMADNPEVCLFLVCLFWVCLFLVCLFWVFLWVFFDVFLIFLGVSGFHFPFDFHFPLCMCVRWLSGWQGSLLVDCWVTPTCLFPSNTWMMLKHT